MDLRLTHYKLAPCLLPDTPVLHLAPGEPLWRLAVQGVFQASREINWARTFARRGLALEDYQERSSDPACYCWSRRATAPEDLPSWVSFSRDDEAGEGSLQGDLITFVRQELVLPLVCDRTLREAQYYGLREYPDRLGEELQHGFMREDFEPHFISWIEPRCHQRLQDNFLSHWEEGMSFVTWRMEMVPF